MKDSRRRFSVQEKLEILYQVDELGMSYVQCKYNISPDIIFRWEKDLKKSKTRQAAIKKQGDAQVIESMKAKIEQLKKVIADQTALLQNSEQKPQVNEPTTNGKEDEFYRLIASLIVQNLLNNTEEESGNNHILAGE